ncbi:MFS transporter [Humidisolicoccus flavus]|uniref:MFS transporter n=1 Tax=Humidisolicoccus flavus TaxID=3111414 RepID=UPI0032469527
MQSRLFWSLLFAGIALNAMYAAVAGMIVPAQIALAEPANKEPTLALVMTASSIITIIVRPLAGAASDRTRTRWGRRSPWILGGALVAAALMIASGFATSVVAIAGCWLILQPVLNTIEAPLDAVLADRLRVHERARGSAFAGAGAAIGLAAGTAFAGLALDDPQFLYQCLAIVLVLTMLGFVWLNPERNIARTTVFVRPKIAWKGSGLPLLFAGRFVLVLGHQLVMTYLLYIVMDFTNLDVADAGRTVSTLIGGHIVCIVIGAFLGSRFVMPYRVRWLLIATAIIAAGLLVPLVSPTLAGLAIYAAIAGLGRGIFLTADVALMLDLLPSGADSGRDLGFLGLATVLPQVLAPAIAGSLLIATANSYSVLFACAVIGVVGSVPFIIRLRRVLRARVVASEADGTHDRTTSSDLTANGERS